MTELDEMCDLEVIKSIEECEFKCEGGPLENNVNWIELKRRTSYKNVSPDIVEPKEVTYVDRMRFERNDLCTKLNKLIKFQITETFKNLDDFQKEHLSIQCYLMQRYLEVLNDRIIYELELNDKK